MQAPVICGIVLTGYEYKESNLILKVLTEDGIVSVLARGVLKQNSKNRILTVPFSIVELEYDPKYSHEMYFLIRGKVLFSPDFISENMQDILLCQLIARFLLLSEFAPGFYPAFEQMLYALEKKDRSKALFCACWLAMHMAIASGVGMNLSHCTVCSKTKNIVGVSLENGGFVCMDHLSAGVRLSKKKLKQLLLLSRYQFQSENTWYEKYDWSYSLLILLLEWFADAMDLRRSEIQFFKTMVLDKDEEPWLS